MKLVKIYKFVVLSVMILTFHSCTHEDKPTESRLVYTQPVKTDLDKWIAENFTNPYNINAYYEWNQNMVDNSRYLFPPTIDKVKPALEIVKKVWIDSYTTTGGVDFIKKIAPKEFIMVGGVNLNSTGTVTLGLAEGGQRISFFEVDQIDKKKRKDVIKFIHTIQHEYVHILNQNKPFNEQAWSKITPSGYTSSWNTENESVSRNLGFVTNYARLNIYEDFAETTTMLLISSKSEYQAILNGIGDPAGKAALVQKEALVVRYYKDLFNIDLYALRDEVQKNIDIVIK